MRLSEVNNDKRWLVGMWYVGFMLVLSGGAVIIAYAVAGLLQRYGALTISGWVLYAGCGLLIAAAAIDLPMAYVRRRRKQKR